MRLSRRSEPFDSDDYIFELKTAGYSSNRAASNALSSMRARGELIEELVAQGWSPREFVKKHVLPMLTRKKVQYFQNQGIVTDKRVTEDTEAQLVAGLAVG